MLLESNQGTKPHRHCKIGPLRLAPESFQTPKKQKVKSNKCFQIGWYAELVIPTVYAFENTHLSVVILNSVVLSVI